MTTISRSDVAPRWYAEGARSLLDTRHRGLRPDVPIAVLMGRTDASPPVLHVRDDAPLARLDWSMLVDLDVWLYADFHTRLDRILVVARDIAKARPREFVLRFTDHEGWLHDVGIGSGCHRAGLPEHGIEPEHSFLFFPMNLAGTTLGRRLVASLWSIEEAACI